MSLLSLYVPERWDSTRDDLTWRWRHDAGPSGALGDGQPLPPAREVRVVLAATQVLQTLVDLPRRGRWQEALPFALEDRLLGDPEHLHVAAGAALAGGLTPVLAVDRQWLAAILERLAALGLHAQGVYSAASLLECRAEEWTVLIEPAGGLLATPDGRVVALDESAGGAPPQLLIALLDTTDPATRPARLRARARAHAELAVALAEWPAQLGLPVEPGAAWVPELPTVLPGASINLLQGRFAPTRQSGLSPGLKPLRPALWLLVASLLVWLLATAIQTMLWQSEARSLQARGEAALRRAFPETRTILDAPLQLRRGLEALRATQDGGGDSALATLLARLSGVSEGLPVRLRHLEFQHSWVMLDWDCADSDCARTLRQRLREAPRGSEVIDVNEPALRVRARLRAVAP
jgi:general secretion pathway protein L